MTNAQSNNNTANTINQNTITQGTSNAMQQNISLAEDTGESSNMNLDSAAPMETEGRGGDPNAEPKMMEITREGDANTNNETDGSEPTGGEKTAPKKSSKAKGKQKATSKDGEGDISGSKRRVTEKKMTHAIKEVKKTSIQESIKHMQGVINQATLGYTIITVIHDNNLGIRPTIQCCQVNIHLIDPTFLEEFSKGMTHSIPYLQYLKAKEELCKSSSAQIYDAFKEAMQVAQKVVRDGGIWLIRFFDLDFIDGHKDRALIESHLATNPIVPVHQDSEHDSLQMIMNVLLYNQNPDAREQYIKNFLEKTASTATSQLGKILRDWALFDAVFNLFQYEHFCSWDNTGTGLSIHNISKWLPTIGGTSRAMIYISQCCSQILHFLATPIEFMDVDPETPDNQLDDAFLTKFNLVKAEFEKSLPLSACQVLDKRYFKDWTDIYVKMVGSSEKEDQLAPIEFFGSMQEDEAQKYSRYMSKYWNAMVVHAEREQDSTIYVPRDVSTHLIKNSMPIKLKALCHGLMGKFLGDKFADQFPVPTKVLMYTLGEQLRSIEPAIREATNVVRPSKGYGALHGQKVTEGTGIQDLEPPKIIKDELEPEQFRFLEFVSQVLCHTSFPWMDSAKLKKSDTLLKKLVPLYKSYRAHHTLLATDVAWRIWHSLTCVLLVGVQKKDKSGRWEWLGLHRHLKSMQKRNWIMLKLHQCNHDKLKLIIPTALSPEFGLGLGDRALPKANGLVGKLVDELKLCSEIAVHCLQCPTEAFVPERPREMDILYPLGIPDSMSAEDTRHYKDKQLGSGIANLSSLPTFDNAAKDLWVAEKKAAQAEEERQCELMKQHENVKVVQSARAERVAKVAEMRRARKIKSAPIILDSDEEGVNMEDTAPKAGPSNTTNASTTSTATHTSLPWLPLTTMAYSWEGFKTIAKQATPDIAFKELPALLYLLLMVLDLARSKPEAKSKVESIIQMVDRAQGMPDPQMILSPIVGLQGLGCQASKYVKKAQELVTAGTATGMISVKEAA
ncbi:hypothetical protein EDC04DRAFT_2600254 [Pisolithus marmoratus]|nr:hypothetical protein EDC04DRAFT_2600254 [Pisolithus marmoratus]